MVTLKHTVTESRNSLRLGETYHALVRKLFNKVSVSYPSEHRKLRLALSVKAVNDTAGPQGLVPSLLAFGMIPKIPGQKSSLEGHHTRINMMQVAPEEYETILVRNRVLHALKNKVQPSAHFRFTPGQPVNIYRETPIRKWTGLQKLISAVGKKIMADFSDRTDPRSFNLAQLKPAKLPSISPLLSPTPKIPKPFNFEHQKPEQQATPQYYSPPISELQGRAAISRPFFTEVISPKDSRIG